MTNSNPYSHSNEKGRRDDQRSRLQPMRKTYYNYDCPNNLHLFALLGDTETCIYCYVKDNPLTTGATMTTSPNKMSDEELEKKLQKST